MPTSAACYLTFSSSAGPGLSHIWLIFKVLELETESYNCTVQDSPERLSDMVKGTQLAGAEFHLFFSLPLWWCPSAPPLPVFALTSSAFQKGTVELWVWENAPGGISCSTGYCWFTAVVPTQPSHWYLALSRMALCYLRWFRALNWAGTNDLCALPARSHALVRCVARPLEALCGSARARWRGAGWAPDFRSRHIQPVTVLVGSEEFGLRIFGERFSISWVGCGLFRCDTALPLTSDLGTSPLGRQRGKVGHSVISVASGNGPSGVAPRMHLLPFYYRAHGGLCLEKFSLFLFFTDDLQYYGVWLSHRWISMYHPLYSLHSGKLLIDHKELKIYRQSWSHLLGIKLALVIGKITSTFVSRPEIPLRKRIP